MKYYFGDYELDSVRFSLRWRGGDVPIQPQSLDLLLLLVENRDRLVTKEELLEAVWRGLAVSEGAVSQAVSTLRRTIGDDGGRQELIRTVRGRGFRFVGKVSASGVASPAPPELPTAALVGRNQDLVTLEGIHDEVLAGTGAVVLVTGEPGVGKTALLAALREGLETRGEQCLSFQCGTADDPLRGIIRWLLLDDARSTLDPSTDEVAPLVWTLALDERGSADVGGPPFHRSQVFTALRRALRSASEATPLVILLDGLSSVEEPLISFLRSCSDPEDIGRTLVVATVTEPQDAYFSHSEPATLVVGERLRLRLRGLDREASTALLHRVLGRTPTSEEVTTALHHSAGNPTLLRDVALAIRHDRLRRWEILDSAPTPRARLEAAIRRVVDALTSTARLSLSAAAVLGPVGDEAVVMAMLRKRLEPSAVAAGCAEAQRAGLVTRVSSSSYRFDSELVQRTLYQSLDAVTRGDLHRAAAVVLDRWGTDLLGGSREARCLAAAQHYEASRSQTATRRMLECIRQAAADSMRGLGYHRAAHLLEFAERVATILGDIESIVDLRVQRGHALTLAGHAEAARLSFRSATVAARACRDWNGFARATIGYGTAQRAVGDETLIRLLREALNHRDELDERTLTATLAEFSHALRLTIDSPEGCEAGREAAEMARRRGDQAILARALCGRLQLESLDAQSMQTLANAAVVSAEQCRDERLLAEALVARMAEHLACGDRDAYLTDVEWHARVAGSLGDAWQHICATRFASVRALLDGRLAQAEARAMEAMALGRTIGDPGTEIVFAAQTLVPRREQGRAAELEPLLATIAKEDGHLGRFAHAALALVRSIAGRRVLAQATLRAILRREPRRTLCHHQLPHVACMAEAAWLAGCARSARFAQPHLEAHAKRHVVAMDGVLYLGPVARYLGLASATSGQWNDAARHLRAALLECRRIGARYWEGRVLVDLARVHTAATNAGDAQRASAEAGRIAVMSEYDTLRVEALGALAESPPDADATLTTHVC